MQLLDKYCCIDLPLEQDGKTALHVASEHGHAETVEALVKLGADVNVTDFVSFVFFSTFLPVLRFATDLGKVGTW